MPETERCVAPHCSLHSNFYHPDQSDKGATAGFGWEAVALSFLAATVEPTLDQTYPKLRHQLGQGQDGSITRYGYTNAPTAAINSLRSRGSHETQIWVREPTNVWCDAWQLRRTDTKPARQRRRVFINGDCRQQASASDLLIASH